MIINTNKQPVFDNTVKASPGKQDTNLSKDLIEKGSRGDEIADLQKQMNDMQNRLLFLSKEQEGKITEYGEHVKDHLLSVFTHEPVASGTISKLLDGPEYKNISLEDGFKMLGYFTQKSHAEGYPWMLMKPGGLLKQGKEISLMDAAKRLSKGEEVIMQPMRSINLNFSPEQIASVAGVASPTSSVATTMSTLAKDGKVTATPLSKDMKFGAPIAINSFGELKLLDELYNPDMPGVSGHIVSDAAKSLAKFTRTTSTNYPWKTLKSEPGDRTLWKVLKGASKKAFVWGAVGLGAGVVIGGLGALLVQGFAALTIFGVKAAAVAVVGTGAIAGANGLIKGAKETLKGKEINAFETLSRVIDNKPVILQKQEKHGIGIPIIGDVHYFSDYGESNVIEGVNELKMFANVLPEQPLTKTEPEKPKT